MHLVMHQFAFARKQTISILLSLSVGRSWQISFILLNVEADTIGGLTSALWGEIVFLSGSLKSGVKNEAFYSALLLARKAYFSDLNALA